MHALCAHKNQKNFKKVESGELRVENDGRFCIRRNYILLSNKQYA